MNDPGRIPDFRDRLSFDAAHGAIHDGDIRYVLIRQDSLMGMFTRLPPPARREALAALADSVAEHGRRSAERYAAEQPGRDLAALIAATAPQLGWGEWRMTQEPCGLQLTVTNSPFAAGHGPAEEPVCAPITGMLQALGAILADAPLEVVETSCAANGSTVCTFHARPMRNAGHAPRIARRAGDQGAA